MLVERKMKNKKLKKKNGWKTKKQMTQVCVFVVYKFTHLCTPIPNPYLYSFYFLPIFFPIFSFTILVAKNNLIITSPCLLVPSPKSNFTSKKIPFPDNIYTYISQSFKKKKKLKKDAVLDPTRLHHYATRISETNCWHQP